MTGQPKIYTSLADWFHLLTAPEDYAEEAALYTERLIEACDTPPRTVLEPGSGGGQQRLAHEGALRVHAH